MKFNIESPYTLLDYSRSYNDYDYCLANLVKGDDRYLTFFKESISLGREVYLDNTSLNINSFHLRDRWIGIMEDLRPQYFFLPYNLCDRKNTLRRVRTLYDKYDLSYSKGIGFIQGNNYSELATSYEELAPLCYGIGFMYDLAYQPEFKLGGRFELLKMLLKSGVLRSDKYHHLHGCVLPQEGLLYKDFPYISTIKTHFPALCTVHGKEMDKDGVKTPLQGSIAGIMDIEAGRIDKGLLDRNIEAYKKLWN